MLHAARHKLRVVIRLAALLVLLGLGTVPVECAAVYGPHSIFVSAEAVAQVRDGGHHHAHGAAAAATETASVAMPEEHVASHDPAPSGAASADAGVTTSLPAPAGTAVDALIAVAVFEPDSAPGPGDFSPVSRFIPPLADHLLPAPEPPPPQSGS